ncbi:MAG: zf-HC2 domain-containing protein [Deltaproteobacteria bacterium]|nr:zf-HC2 domain-containing protein [Deltaproteobacteria bacterium]
MSSQRPASTSIASCAEVDAKLFELTENELPAAETERLMAHARGCAGCADLVESYRATPVLARRVLLEDVPVDVTERLLGVIAQNVNRK